MKIFFDGFEGNEDIITEEMHALLQQAANTAFETEFRDDMCKASPETDAIETGVSLAIVDEDEIKRLNREYRGRDSITDVLSFPQFDSRASLLDELSRSDIEETLIGDVVICTEQVKRQAEEYGTGIKREMLYLFVHSIMHLFGYDHINEDDREVMRRREEEVLHAIGVDR